MHVAPDASEPVVSSLRRGPWRPLLLAMLLFAACRKDPRSWAELRQACDHASPRCPSGEICTQMSEYGKSNESLCRPLVDKERSRRMGGSTMLPVRVETALGTLELLLPEGAALERDPGVADGEMLVWAPAPELGVFSISHGPAQGRRMDDLLALERAFADDVEVEAAEEGELRLRVVTLVPRNLVEDPSGPRTHTEESTRQERLRFRYWESGDAAVSAGYRVDERASAELRATFDRIADSLRLAPTL